MKDTKTSSNPEISDLQAGTDKKEINTTGNSQERKKPGNIKVTSSQMKVIQTLSVVGVTFIVCFVPSMMTIWLSSVLTREEMKFYYTLSNILAFVNCAVNPIIYVGMHSAMRKKFLETIKFCK